jgi:SMI1/KNR4 family protein SUKH-1
MIESVRANLARLEPIKEKVFRSPMTEEELAALEREVGLAIPSCLREYLRLVGLREDLTSHEASEFAVFDRKEDFRMMRQFLLKHFGGAAAPLFPFGDDGAGSVIAVVEGKECCRMVFADHETEKISEIGTFCGWLTKVVDAALKQGRPPSSEKKWYVQFTFRVPTVEPILETLRRFGPANLGAWSETKITPARVQTYEAPLTLGLQQLLLKKSEYHAWAQPMFAFDYEEPATTPKEQSRILKFDEAFRAADLGYKLVDYGVLFMEDKDDAAAEPQCKSPAKPWWKFW